MFGRTVPINLSHASTHTPVSAQPVESHPVFFLRPYRDVSLPRTHPPSQEAPKSQQGSKAHEETFPHGMQRIRTCIPLPGCECKRRWRRASCCPKLQQTSSPRGKMSTWGGRDENRCGGAGGISPLQPD